MRYVKLGYSKQKTHSFKPCAFNVGVCKSMEVEKNWSNIIFKTFLFFLHFIILIWHFTKRKHIIFPRAYPCYSMHTGLSMLSSTCTVCLGSLAWPLAQSIPIYLCTTLTIEQYMYLSKYLSRLVWSTRLKVVRVVSVSFRVYILSERKVDLKWKLTETLIQYRLLS